MNIFYVILNPLRYVHTPVTHISFRDMERKLKRHLDFDKTFVTEFFLTSFGRLRGELVY